MEIPKIIQETAEKEGCNRITYLGKRNGKDAYTMGYVSEDGSLPCPTWRKRSMPTQSRRFNPPTFEVKNGLETA